MALGLMAMPTKIAFHERKTLTREASTKDPRCSYSAKPNPPRTLRKTSVLTSGTCGRKSEYVSVELLRRASERAGYLVSAGSHVARAWCSSDREATPSFGYTRYRCAPTGRRHRNTPSAISGRD